jgi:hypothetical protein
MATKKIQRKCKGEKCEVIFNTREANKNLYCSKECQLRYLSEVRTCVNVRCGKEFTPVQRVQKLCSKECSDVYWSFEYNAEYGVIDHRVGWFKLRFEVFKRDNFSCVYCGRNVREDGIKLHCDHIDPKSKGGEDTLINLVTSCGECNLGKSNTII